jgi:hypothetical protein
VVTGTAPTANFRKGFTTGRVGVDWFNHLDGNVHGISPFVNFGAANNIIDRHFLPRPYSMVHPYITQGFVADFEGGVNYKIRQRLTVGGSYYDVLPAGPQKAYSRIVQRGEGPRTSNGGHARFWQSAFETKGSARFFRDNGFSGTFAVSPVKVMDIEIGYTRSVRYALNAISVGVVFNVNSVARKVTNY